MKKAPTLLAVALTATLLAARSDAAVFAFEFNTVGDTEGWTASTAPNPNGVVTGFAATTGIDGSTGVATSADVNIDPQVLRTGAGNTLTLPAGEMWSTMEVRFRQLSLNPGEPGVTSAPFNGNGTILFFNGATTNLGVAALATKTVNGTGAYVADTYNMTLTAETSGDWQVMLLDFSAAPTLKSQNLTAVRFDPVGNDAAKNFEIDYIRFASVPEPGSAVLSLMAATGLLLRRRRR
jgi:hypothetical protein